MMKEKIKLTLSIHLIFTELKQSKHVNIYHVF